MDTAPTTPKVLPISNLAENLIGSEVIKIAGEINARKAAGETIYNLTIGDFDPSVFPLPEKLTAAVVKAYQDGHTNYPQANGMAQLRNTLSDYIKDRLDLEYSPENILVSGGARPLIYASYRAVVDPGEKVIYPVPSWNNNHYAYLGGGDGVAVLTKPEDSFMPSAELLRPHIQKAGLVALCSPLNPTGTCFSDEDLSSICDLILEENKRRGDAKPVYLIYDQIYNELRLDGIDHVHPVQLRPEMRAYTIYIDGISKAYAATGVRVGWAYGPEFLMQKMKAILSHVGAWSPKPEQMACAEYLADKQEVDSIVKHHNTMLTERLEGLYRGLEVMKQSGLPIDVIAPEGALYLTVKIDVIGKTSAGGKHLQNAEDIAYWLIEDAGVGLVPFYAFGADRDYPWFRLSVGTTRMEDLPKILNQLEGALKTLS